MDALLHAMQQGAGLVSPLKLSHLIPASFHTDAKRTLVRLYIFLLLPSRLLLNMATAPPQGSATAAYRRTDRRTLACVAGNRSPDRAKRRASRRAMQKGLHKEAAAALRNYLAKENDTSDTHQRIE